MNSKELYVCIAQILSTTVDITRPTKTDYTREAKVVVSANHLNGYGASNISHATIEFSGVRAKFLCSLIFDGAGSHDTSVHNFSMPRQKMSMEQKALACLAVVQYLIDQEYIVADMNFFKEKFHFDVSGGVGDLLKKYESLVASSKHFLLRDNNMQPA